MTKLIKVVGYSVIISIVLAGSHASIGANHWFKLQRNGLTVGVDKDFTLHVYQESEDPVWQSREESKPTLTVSMNHSDDEAESIQVPLANASVCQKVDIDDGTYQGHRLCLRGLPGTDVEVNLVYALAKGGELLVQIEQVGGKQVVQKVSGLYDWELKPAADAYMVVPRGSGYMIRCDSPQAVTLDGFVGAQYSLPLFGVIRGPHTCYQIIENWWDAAMVVKHTPNDGTTMSLEWEPSHGKLAYPRRVLLRFVDNVDHVGMAKAYRRYLIARKEFVTLKERAKHFLKLKQYLAGIEYRWIYFKSEEYEDVLDNICRFQDAGLPVSFFYSKWLEEGRGAYADWQDVMTTEPISGGWPAANEMADTIHKLGCTVQVMVNPHKYYKDGAGYDPAKASDVSFPALSSRYALESNKRLLDFFEDKGFPFDALYFDGYSECRGMREHSDAKGPVTRRLNFEAQTACFRQTRDRGYLTGAEQARFWSIPDCDFYFFTDWFPDRLREGEPIPLFSLVFHDCYGAHFSGGGYYEEGKYDWYADRHPRLYELMYAAIPSHY